MQIKLKKLFQKKLLYQNKLVPLKEAIRSYHFPESTDKLNSARQRFKFEELFYLELLVALKKAELPEQAH